MRTIEDRDLLSPRIRQYQEAFGKGMGVGSKANEVVSEADLKRVDESLNVSFSDRVSYQDVRAWGYASGIISPWEARIINLSLGGTGSASNGGWAAGTDLATKVVVTQVVTEVLRLKMNLPGR